MNIWEKLQQKLSHSEKYISDYLGPKFPHKFVFTLVDDQDIPEA